MCSSEVGGSLLAQKVMEEVMVTILPLAEGDYEPIEFVESAEHRAAAGEWRSGDGVAGLGSQFSQDGGLAEEIGDLGWLAA